MTDQETDKPTDQEAGDSLHANKHDEGKAPVLKAPALKAPKGKPAIGSSSTDRSPDDRTPIHPGIVDHLAGEAGDFVADLVPHLPEELIGGSLPYVPGSENSAVWNAASQACATESVHYCYTIDADRVWYLACPSHVLASHPDSWCPLAAALPGNSEYWDRETVYLYEQEGQASALRWDPDTGRMQVFLGASRTILPRMQSMDANFVTINADLADIVPWRNRTLRTEKLSRATIRALLYIAVIISLVGAGMVVFNYIALNFIDRNLTEVKVQSEEASHKLMLEASNAMRSDTAKHMVCIQHILDSLIPVEGTLVRYQIKKGGRAEWEALVPDSFSKTFGKAINKEEDGRVRVKGKSRFCP